MCKAFDDMIEEGRLQGRQEGEWIGKLALIQKMFKKHMTATDIANLMEEDVEVIERVVELFKEHPTYDMDKIYQEYKGLMPQE